LRRLSLIVSTYLWLLGRIYYSARGVKSIWVQQLICETAFGHITPLKIPVGRGVVDGTFWQSMWQKLGRWLLLWKVS